MRIMVVGAGGREHALVWRLSQDPGVERIACCPGNPGISTLCETFPVDPLSPEAVLAAATARAIDLTVVGPEAPLERGLADLFRQAGHTILGPSRLGAALECSKVFSKQFMVDHGIPTAAFTVATSADEARAALRSGQFGLPVVIKADGLAAGKGVVIADTFDEADRAVQAAMVDQVFGRAGAQLVIEECLSGPEVSAFFLCDGTRAVALSSAQDHKRIWDDDRGPNTGGMGAFAPSPLYDDRLEAFTRQRVVEPVLTGMHRLGSPFIGFLYVSLMLTSAGPKVIEFNVRFGDPEAQVVLPGINGPFAETLRAAAEGRLPSDNPLEVSAGRTVGVVVASPGYPTSSRSGTPIEGLAAAAAVPGALVFHAGTASSEGRVVTAGGRVITVVGRGTTYRQAMSIAYDAVGQIRFDGMQYRRDIGLKALGPAGEPT